MKKQAKAKTKAKINREASAHNAEPAETVDYVGVFDDTLNQKTAELWPFATQMNLAKWRTLQDGNVKPGLYVVENYEGFKEVAYWTEVTFGDGDPRNNAGFVTDHDDEIKPYRVRRYYGPIEL